jgi:hypothetical protein
MISDTLIKKSFVKIFHQLVINILSKKLFCFFAQSKKKNAKNVFFFKIDELDLINKIYHFC